MGGERLKRRRADTRHVSFLRAAASASIGVVAVGGVAAAGWFYLDSTTTHYDAVPAVQSTVPRGVTAVTPDDAARVLALSATAWDLQTRVNGGATTVIQFDDVDTVAQLAPSGDVAAETTNPDRPEWVLSGHTLFARLGEEELKRNRESLSGLGKVNAEWTDAAIGSDRERELLRFADLSKMAAVASSEGAVFRVEQGDGDVTVTTSVPAASLGVTTLFPDSGTVEVSVTLGSDRLVSKVRVRTTAGDTVTALFDRFGPVVVTAPSPDDVITMDDLIALTAPVEEALPSAPASER